MRLSGYINTNKKHGGAGQVKLPLTIINSHGPILINDSE